jgi:hypothetical protein
MAFNYQSAGPAGQTVLSPTSKDVQCKSFKIDLSVANATTAVVYDMGWLPKDAQVVNGFMAITTAVSGPSVTAATIQVQVNGTSVWNGGSVFSITTSNVNSVGYFGTGLSPTTDQKVTFTLTLTGGATATAGVIYVNIFYVI